MSRKYFLIPEDLYKGLTEIEPENYNLDFEKKEVSKTKKLPKIDADSKNIQYNQEFKKYLKFKKELENKPVKVELTNGANLITKAKNLRSSIAPRGRKRRISTAPRRSSFSSSYTSSTRTHNRSSDGDDDDDQTFFTGETGEDSDVDNTLIPNPNMFQAQLILDKDNLKNELKTYIFNDPKKFNILPDGTITNPGKKSIISGSNVDESLERLMFPTVENMPSPPGTKFLKTAIFKDPRAKDIFDRRSQIPSTPLTSRGLINQQGKGRKLNGKLIGRIIKTKNHIYLGQKFRPTIWK